MSADLEAYQSVMKLFSELEKLFDCEDEFYSKPLFLSHYTSASVAEKNN